MTCYTGFDLKRLGMGQLPRLPSCIGTALPTKLTAIQQYSVFCIPHALYPWSKTSFFSPGQSAASSGAETSGLYLHAQQIFTFWSVEGKLEFARYPTSVFACHFSSRLFLAGIGMLSLVLLPLPDIASSMLQLEACVFSHLLFF